MKQAFALGLTLLMAGYLSGCSGIQTFPNSARAGDTTAISTGWKHDFSRDNLTVTITPSIGSPIVLPPGDPAVRAVVNFYPDPLSSIVVSDATGENITPYAVTYAEQLSYNFTDGDKDWWQTTVFLDLPDTLPAGTTLIEIASPAGELHSSTVEILPGTGEADLFTAEMNGPLTDYQLQSLQRVPHYVVSISGVTIPHALQLEMVHDASQVVGGSGVVHVVNPKGDIKNVSWRDDGINLRILLLPSGTQTLSGFKDFKFYVAGGIANLQVADIIAVDIDGNPVAGVSASIVTNN